MNSDFAESLLAKKAANEKRNEASAELEVRRNPLDIAVERLRKVLAAYPNAEWKVIFALCRFGGLRCPSEVLTLRWDGIDWQRGRVLVRSPKTEHHERGEYRTIPLFPELRNALSELDLATPNGGEFVIAPRANGGTSNLRTTFSKIIARLA